MGQRLTEEPLVSFIVNCYNGEEYLNKCFNSILAQEYSNWELIFWDNASTDNSIGIFKSFRDSRFKYFKSEKNVSLGQARAWAVNECKGKYIAFLDVDDEWVPEKTHLQVLKMEKDNSILSYGGIQEVYQNNNKSKKILPHHTSENNFKKNLLQFEINMPTIMIQREALKKKNLNFDPSITASEEYCLCMQLIYNEKVSVLNKPLAKYLVRKDSLTNKNSQYWAHERLYTLYKLESTHPDIKIKFKQELKEAYSRASYYKTRHLMFINNRKEALIEMGKVKFVNFRYFTLYMILLLSSSFWKKVHEIKNARG